MKKTIVLAAVAASIAGGAYAGAVEPVAVVEAMVAAEPAAEVTDWSGFYVGGMASTDSGSTQWFDYEEPSGNPFDMEGSMYGAFAGYNFQRGAIVYGGELAYSIGSTYLTEFPTYEFTNFIDVKGRVGYSFGSALVYAVVGGSAGSWTNNTQGTYDRVGMSYGAGIDVLVTDRFFIGGEYLIRSLSGDFAPLVEFESTEHEVNSLQIRAGMKF